MEKLKTLLKELMEEMGIKENIQLRLAPMKQKIASLSFRSKVLRLNKKVAAYLNDEELKYVFSHELIHFKIRDVNHGFLFLEELQKYYTVEERDRLETGIIKKCLAV